MLLRRDGGNSLAIDILAALYLSLLLCLVLVVCASPEPPSAPPEVCPLCNQSHCPPLDCNESLQYTDECECCTRCAKLEGERCGGRGDVGGRRCNGTDLYCATRVGRIFGEERLGVCERSVCLHGSCGYRKRCKVVVRDNGTVKFCTCDHFRCEHKLNMVCGRNGITYPSVCHLQLAECLSEAPIGILHFNECEVYTPPTPTKTNSQLYSPPPAVFCTLEDGIYSLFDIVPPSSHNPCIYHVCSEHGVLEEYPVLGCEGSPPEEDWKVEEAVVPATWGEWAPYSQCIGDCENGGTALRTRTCTVPSHVEADPSTLLCQGETEDRKQCLPHRCQICNMTEWTPWSLCSTVQPCQLGLQTRTRTLTNTPPYPELCGPTSENRTCHFAGPCDSCTKINTKWFNIVDTRSGCFNRRPKISSVCKGSCGDNKCCSAVFDKRDRFTQLVFTMDCPDDSVKPYVQQFSLPVACRCVDCNEVEVPEFLKPRWRIVYP